MLPQLIFLYLLTIECQSVPFVTKRVSLHNPIKIDFSGWRPLRPNDAQSIDNQYLTVPVAVETDAEHQLSEQELNQIREHVIQNWRQKTEKQESFGSHLKPLLTQLLPKPEIEKEVLTTATTDNEYTFVKMDKNGTQDNLFHAYFANKDHIPPEGYIRMTKPEFKDVFKNAEILFI